MNQMPDNTIYELVGSNVVIELNSSIPGEVVLSNRLGLSIRFDNEGGATRFFMRKGDRVEGPFELQSMVLNSIRDGYSIVLEKSSNPDMLNVSLRNINDTE